METHPILQEIEAFCAKHQMAESTFGRLAAAEWRFIKELRGSSTRRPRRLWPEKEEKVRKFMREYRPKAQGH